MPKKRGPVKGRESEEVKEMKTLAQSRERRLGPSLGYPFELAWYRLRLLFYWIRIAIGIFIFTWLAWSFLQFIPIFPAIRQAIVEEFQEAIPFWPKKAKETVPERRPPLTVRR